MEGAGITVRYLPADELGGDLYEIRKISDDEIGVMIADVSGPAQLAGVEAGDILLGVNGKPVSTPQEVRAATLSAKGKVALQLMRDGDVLFVPVSAG